MARTIKTINLLTLTFLTFLALAYLCAPAMASSGEAPAPSDVREVLISVAGNDFTLILSPNHLGHSLDTNNTSLWKGHVEGDDKSWVRVLETSSGLSGHAKVFGELIKLELDTTGGVKKRHIVDKNTQATADIQGRDKVLLPPANSEHHHNDQFQQLARAVLQSKATENSHSVRKVMPIAIVIDSRFNEFYSGQGLEKALSVINSVDGLYQEQFGLGIELRSAVVLDNGNDPFIDIDGNIESMLRSFRSYVLETPGIYEGLTLTHLFTGSYDEQGIIGLSWIDAACRSDGYNVSVSTPFAQQMLLAAHEMGHNLGAVHDDHQSCEVEQNKIMWPSISAATDSKFSNCSKISVAPSIDLSCNLDNIDVATSISSLTPAQEHIKKVAVSVNNLDTQRLSGRVTSITQIPDGVRVLGRPNECSEIDNAIHCDHGQIAANKSSSVVLDIELQSEDERVLNSHLVVSGFVDLIRTNNRASLSLFTEAEEIEDVEDAEQSDSETLNDSEATASDTLTQPAQTQSGGAGGGSINLLSTLFLITLLFSRKTTRKSRQHEQRRNRVIDQNTARLIV